MKNAGTDENEKWVPDTSVEEMDITKAVDAGKYRIVIDSTQYSTWEEEDFNKSYWGHRGYYNFAEITPADTQTTLKVTNTSGSEDLGLVSPSDTLSFDVQVTPHHGDSSHKSEATTCEAPQGAVQLYLVEKDGTKTAFGDPIPLTAASEADTSGYKYSTGTVSTTLDDFTARQLYSGAKIVAKYVCSNGNYTTSKDDKALEEHAPLTITKTLTADAGAELPDGSASEYFAVALSALYTDPDNYVMPTGKYPFHVENAKGETVTTDNSNDYEGVIDCSDGYTIYVGVYDKDGATANKVDTTDSFTNAGGTFQLKAGEKLVIEGLPKEVQFAVSELLTTAQANAGYYTGDISTDNAAGESASIKGINDDWTPKYGSLTTGKTTTVTVANGYKTATLDGATVTKQLDGREWADDEEFKFTLTPVDTTASGLTASTMPMPSDAKDGVATLTMGKTGSTVGTNKGGKIRTTQTASFGDITYTKADTYTYVVRESVPSSTDASFDKNLAYSKEAYRITVVVDNATDEYSYNTGLEVKSVTKTQTCDENGNLSLDLYVAKDTTDWGIIDLDSSSSTFLEYTYKNIYKLTLYDADSEVMGEVEFTAPDSYYDDSPSSEYMYGIYAEEAGTYTYTLTEEGTVWTAADKAGEEPTSSSYTTKYTITVKIEQAADGTLSVASMTKAFVESDRKIWVDDGTGNQVQQDVTADDGTVSITAMGIEVDDISFTNTKVDDIEINSTTRPLMYTVEKTLENRPEAIVAGEFSVDVTGIDHGTEGDSDYTTAAEAMKRLYPDTTPTPSVKNVAIDAGVTYKTGATGNPAARHIFAGAKFSYADVGKSFDYAVREHIPDDAVNPVMKYTDSEGKLLKYKDADAEQQAATGWRYNGVSYSNDVFTVRVTVCYDTNYCKDGNGLYAQVIAIDKNGEDAGTTDSTHNASVYEPQDNSGFGPSSGSMSHPKEEITNTYRGDDPIKVDIDTDGTTQLGKVLTNGDTWQGTDDFTFTVEATSYQAVDANGKGTGEVYTSGENFEAIPLPQVNGADATTATVENADAKKATSSDKAAAIDFGTVTFTKAGVYTYTVTENVPADGTGNVKDGVTYTTQAVTITVTVTENTVKVGEADENGKYAKVPDGTLSATVAFDSTSKGLFTNTYEASDTLEGLLDLDLYKTLNGRDINFDFIFTVAGADDASKALLSSATYTVSSGKDGVQQTATTTDTTTLSNLKFTSDNAGMEYSFKVSETSGSEGGIGYDDNYYLLKVTPTDDGTGGLSFSGTVEKYDKDGKLVTSWGDGGKKTFSSESKLSDKVFEFTNTYTAEATYGGNGTVLIPATKTLRKR